MLTHRGFSAWITVDGKELPQYLVAEDAKAARVSCWVPGDAGQRFAVHWKDHGGNVDTCSYISMDGLVVPGRFLFGSGETSREGVRSSATTERPFVFREIQAGVRADDGPSSQSVSKDVGMITLKIKRIQRIAGRPANPIQQVPRSTLGKRKAGELCVGFDDERQTYDQYAFTWSVKPYEKDGPAGAKTPGTYVSFVFRYRTREWLQTQGIMPEPESAVPARRGPAQMRAAMRRVSSAPAVPIPGSPKALLTPRESPTPPPPPPAKRHKPSLQQKPSLPSAPRPRRPSADMRRTVSFQTPSRELSMEQVLIFDTLVEEDHDARDPDWTPH